MRKKNTLRTGRFIVCLFVLLCSVSIFGASSYNETFNSATNLDWGTDVPSIFSSATVQDGYLTVVADGAGGPGYYDVFTLSFPTVDISQNPILKIRTRSSYDFDLRIDVAQLTTGGDVISSNSDPIIYTVTGNNGYKEYIFDFTGRLSQTYPDVKDVDPTQISMLMFFINPNSSDAFYGTIDFDDIRLGDIAVTSKPSYVDQFDDGILATWDAITGSNYTASETGGNLVINATSVGGASGFEAFGIHFDMVDMSSASKQYVTVNVKSTSDVYLRLDVGQEMGDGTSLVGNEVANTIFVTGDNAFHEVTYTITDHFYQLYGDVEGYLDPSKISMLQFYCNAGKTSQYTGTLTFDYVNVGGSGNNQATTYFYEDFADEVECMWYSNPPITPNVASGIISVSTNLTGGNCDYCNFWGEFPQIDVTASPFARVKVKASADFPLRADLQEFTSGLTTSAIPEVRTITGDGAYHVYLFDFRGKFKDWQGGSVDPSIIESIMFFPSPGSYPFSNTFSMDDMEVGYVPTGTAPVLSSIAEQVASSSSLTFNIASYISDDATTDANINFSWKTPTYLNVTKSGTTFTFTPKTVGWSGKDTIVLYATDEEGWQVSGKIPVRFNAVSTNTNLSSLVTSAGILNPTFSATTTTYSVELPAGTSTVPTITALAADANATVSVVNATAIPGSTVVTVTAQDGVTKKIYTISFSTVALSTNAKLASLTAGSYSLSPVFNSTTYLYTVQIPTGSSIPTVVATTQNAAAQMNIQQATIVPGSALITVTAEDGVTKLTYTVNFEYILSNDATLQSLSISSGNLNPSFSASVTSYTVKLPVGTTTVPTIAATVSNSAATVQLTQPTSLPGTAIAKVTAENGTVKTYTISIVLGKSNGFVEDFNDNFLNPTWSTDVPNIFTLEERTFTNDGALKVSVNQAGGLDTYNAFGFSFPAIDIANNEQVSVTLKCSSASASNVSIRMDLKSGLAENGETEYGTNQIPVVKTITTGSSFTTYNFSFTNKMLQSYPDYALVDSTNITKVIFYVNANVAQTFSGTIWIDEIVIGDRVISRPSQYIEDFGDAKVDHITSSDFTEISVSEINNTLQVQTLNAGGPDSFENILFSFTEVDMSGNPYVSVDIKSSKNFVLRIDPAQWSVSGADYLAANSHEVSVDIVGDNAYHTYVFDFSNKFEQAYPTIAMVDPSRISNLYFFMNADKSESLSTIFQMDNIKIGVKPANLPPVISLNNITAFAGDAIAPISLNTYILDDATSFSGLNISVSGGDKVVPSISNGILSLTIADNKWVGTETLYLSAKDASGLQSIVNFKVTVNEVKVTGIQLSSTQLTMNHHDTVQLTAIVLPTNATFNNVTWSSDASAIASVDDEGNVVAESVGATTIRATSEDGIVVSQCLVSVNPLLVSSVVLEKETILIEINDTKQLSPSIEPENATNSGLTWETNNSGIVTVSQSGLITAVSEGSALITVRSADGNASATYKIEVKSILVNTQPVVSTIPDQVINDGETFNEINLSEYVSDDITPNNQLTWIVISSENLQITVANEKLYAAKLSTTWTGTETVTIQVKDEDGLATEFTVTFTVNPQGTNIQTIVNDGVVVYPTINNGTFTVSVPAGELVYSIQVINNQGRIIEKHDVAGDNSVQIKLDVRAGSYLVKVSSENVQSTRLIIVK